MSTTMNRYLFHFIGEDGKTFSDSIPQREYHAPRIIQRLKDEPKPWTRAEFKGELSAITAQIENYRAKFYRTPTMHSWDADRVIYVHPAISDDQAMEIITKVFG